MTPYVSFLFLLENFDLPTLLLIRVGLGVLGNHPRDTTSGRTSGGGLAVTDEKDVSFLLGPLSR